MNAVRLHAEKLVYADGAIREEVIWRVPAPVPPSQHGYKYRLVYVVQGRRVIGFDNERGRATITTGMARNTPTASATL